MVVSGAGKLPSLFRLVVRRPTCECCVSSKEYCRSKAVCAIQTRRVDNFFEGFVKVSDATRLLMTTVICRLEGKGISQVVPGT
jgi:hypothetical protein